MAQSERTTARWEAPDGWVRRHLSGLRALCALLLFVAMSACGDEQVVSITRVELTLPGMSRPLPIRIPRHLNDVLPKRDVDYDLHTRVAMPEGLRGRALTLAIPHLFAHCTLLVDGVEMVELDPSARGTYSGRATSRFRIPANVSAHASLDLTLRVQHRWTQSGWLDTPFRLSATVAGDRFSLFAERFNRIGSWFCLATMFVTFVTSLLVFVVDRRRVAYGWFALEAAFGSVVPLFQIGTAANLFGVYDAVIMGACASSALWASVRFTHAQFHLAPPHRSLDLLLLLTLLLIAGSTGPYVLTERVGATVVGCISVNVVYQVVTTVRLWATGVQRVHALVLAVSWGTLGLFAVPDQVAWVGLGEMLGGVRGAQLGLAVIALLQASVMSHDYIRTLMQTDLLNIELAARVRALESKDLENSALNEVLRRQIAARSEQLAHAIVRLGAARQVNPGEVEVGTILENRYRVVAVLGRGAMGTVYEVERLLDKKGFALKVLSGRGGSVEMARFAREAQLVAQLQHPNVVSIVDVDVSTNGLLFLVLELVRGKSLREHMARAAGDRTFALRVLAQVAEGLSGIHARGIVHRDLKPDNVLIMESDTGDGLSVKITDFGVSRVPDTSEGLPGTASNTQAPDAERAHPTLPSRGEAAGQSGAAAAVNDAQGQGGLTEPGMLIGTPRYMAPEAGEGPTTAGDMFALGVLGFELLVGRPPFAVPLVRLRMAGRPLVPAPPLGEIRPPLPEGLCDVLDSCLAAEPWLRPSAAEVALVLRAYDAARA